MKTNKYCISFNNISYFLHFGHLEEERKLGQRIYIDISINLDESNFSSFNELNEIYDYTTVVDILKKVITKKEYRFLEEISSDISNELLSSDNQIKSILITIRKPSVPIDMTLDDVATTMEFSR